mmetsp:Transcript_77702/g.202445  ORF Transcript_77702/g.202445 Transcript_77702/m.202445 type:complete len:230 (-) Transcript_77702:615-1304(-)
MRWMPARRSASTWTRRCCAPILKLCPSETATPPLYCRKVLGCCCSPPEESSVRPKADLPKADSSKAARVLPGPPCSIHAPLPWLVRGSFLWPVPCRIFRIESKAGPGGAFDITSFPSSHPMFRTQAMRDPRVSSSGRKQASRIAISSFCLFAFAFHRSIRLRTSVSLSMGSASESKIFSTNWTGSEPQRASRVTALNGPRCASISLVTMLTRASRECSSVQRCSKCCSA